MLLGDTSISLLNVGLLTGLSNTVISNIVVNVHYNFSVEDILSQYVFQRSCAQEVSEKIECVISNSR